MPKTSPSISKQPDAISSQKSYLGYLWESVSQIKPQADFLIEKKDWKIKKEEQREKLNAKSLELAEKAKELDHLDSALNRRVEKEKQRHMTAWLNEFNEQHQEAEEIKRSLPKLKKEQRKLKENIQELQEIQKLAENSNTFKTMMNGLLEMQKTQSNMQINSQNHLTEITKILLNQIGGLKDSCFDFVEKAQNHQLELNRQWHDSERVMQNNTTETYYTQLEGNSFSLNQQFFPKILTVKRPRDTEEEEAHPVKTESQKQRRLEMN